MSSEAGEKKVPFSELVVGNCYRVEHTSGVALPGENGYASDIEGTKTHTGKLTEKTENKYILQLFDRPKPHTGIYVEKTINSRVIGNKTFYEIVCHVGGRRSRRHRKNRSYRRSYRHSRKN